MKGEYFPFIFPKAKRELFQATESYETQKTSLGSQFSAIFEEKIERLKTNPFLFQKIYKEVRVVVHMDKFPFSIFYWIDELENVVNIFAIVHQSRHEKIWKSRI